MTVINGVPATAHTVDSSTARLHRDEPSPLDNVQLAQGDANSVGAYQCAPNGPRSSAPDHDSQDKRAVIQWIQPPRRSSGLGYRLATGIGAEVATHERLDSVHCLILCQGGPAADVPREEMGRDDVDTVDGGRNAEG